ncbi:MAG: ABC transporter ATP-binding protein [Sedimentisphaerales bacterium]|nr:ABC transporter ATP-binding protein [Sedimentisphaerales bacterium]
MNPVAVSIKDISKKFRLFNSPKERFLEALHPFNKKYHREFWALRDINFNVQRGATVGIVGRNGSGKSTLLQIIYSVLRPTSGTVETDGRMSALLELGAGFSPEFTGRNNVMMNGTMMGFSAEEMKKRMPVIEAFADIGEFIDQPVKIYSSGMFVRLAFAAAINVDPDILIVDEALAVGDVKFQHKCFQKFEEFQKSGKTIIFVTHDMNAVVRHCDSAVLLNEGRLVQTGKPKDVMNRYMDILESRNSRSRAAVVEATSPADSLDNLVSAEENLTGLKEFLSDFSGIERLHTRKSYNKNEYRQNNGRVDVLDYYIICNGVEDPVSVISGDTIDLYLKVRFNEPFDNPLAGFSVKTTDGLIIMGTHNMCFGIPIVRSAGSEIAIFKFSIKLPLHAGDYFFDIGTIDMGTDILDRRCSAIHLYVHESTRFDGIAYLETHFHEVERKSCNMPEWIKNK